MALPITLRRTWKTSLSLLLSASLLLGPVAPAAAVSLKDIPVVDPTNLHAFVRGRVDVGATPQEIAEAAEAKQALAVLGKALFWDMQVGTDNVMACASCHFNAGADPRPTNQLNPGFLSPDATADTVFGNSVMPGIPGPNSAPWNFGFRPNLRLTPGHFPLHLRENPTAPLVDEAVGTLRDTNDVVSSQGVRESDLPYPFNDGVFNDGGANQRRVEPRNAPTMINAVFHLDMFWDGRGSFIFNGQNPFGFRDRDATVKRNTGTAQAPSVQDVKVRIPYASHASQSVGPPLSHFEMAGTFRTFPELADKMLDPELEVLGLQVVHPEDSVLGPYARADFITGNAGELDDVPGTMSLLNPGESLTYRELVQQAFRDEWWNGGDAQMRENFALFFGLAMQEYQGSLVSDNTPFDRFIGTTNAVREGGGPIAPDPTALTQQELLGLDIFQGSNLSGLNGDPAAVPEPGEPAPGLVNGQCIACHILPETTNHTVRLAGAVDPVTLLPQVDAGGPTDLENVVVPNGIIEAMPMGIATPVDPAVLAGFEDPAVPGQFNLTPQFFIDNPDFLFGWGLYDVGFYNLGVRPTGEDLGRNGSAPGTTGFPLGLPLAYTVLADMIRDGALDPATDADVTDFVPQIPVQANLIEVPLTEPLPDGTTVAVLNGIPTAALNPVTRGAFKVPNLRNQEFQGPYFHNGGAATLRQVVEFYVRGGDFPHTNAAELDADIQPLLGLEIGGAPLPGELVTAEQRVEALTAFLANGLTDPRVANDAAPFDHPQLLLPEGANGRFPGNDRAFELKPTGAAGAESQIPRFLNMDPQATGDPTALGSITGVVTRQSSGEVLAGITVTALHNVNGSWEVAAVSQTTGGGTYDLSALMPGTYKVTFSDEIGAYLGEVYNDLPFGDLDAGANVTVVANTRTANINAALAAVTVDAYEADNTTETAKPVAGNVNQNRTLEAGDSDWVRIAARTGNTYLFETSGAEPVDTYLELFNAAGTRIGANNNGGPGDFSRLEHTASADGDLFLRVRGANSAAAGPYRLTITGTDVTPPTTTSDAVSSYVASATVELTAEDDWSGVDKTEYRVNGSDWTTGTVATVEGVGSYTLEFRSTDNAGNVEQPVSASFTIEPLDATPPITTSDAVSSYIASAIINLSATDNKTGVQKTEYRVNGSPWATGTVVTVNGAGSYTLEFRSTDNAGNVEQPVSASFTIEPYVRTALSVVQSKSRPTWNERVTITGTLRLGSGNGSPLSGQALLLQKSPDGKSWSNVETRQTGANGMASFSVLSQSRTYYRMRYAGKTDQYGPSSSNWSWVLPGVRLTTPSAPSTVNRTKTITSRGILAPRHAAGTKQVVVRAERLERGKWVNRRAFKATASNAGTGASYYTAKYRLPAGVWRIRAHHPNDAFNSSTYSGYRYLVVTR